jgi:cytochrome d ubiquinol oxidase subunit II
MHYDAIKDRSNVIYDYVFKISSVVTPIFLGIIVGASVLGRVNPNAETFYGAFIYPWLNLFSFSVGLFTLALFTFLAAVYLIGETNEAERKEIFVAFAKRTNIAVIIIGALVFITAEINGLSLLTLFLDSWFAIGAIVVATIILPWFWKSLHQPTEFLPRLLAGIQVVIVLLAWFWVQYPVVLNMQGNNSLTFHNTSAPEATLLQLTLALVVGSFIILPYLYYLMRTFKSNQFTTES